MICIQKIYSFHGLNHQIMEESWDVTPVTKGRTEDGKRKIGQCSGRPETAIVLQKLFTHMFPTGSSKRVREKVRDQQSWFAFFAMHFFVDTSETEVTYWTKRKEILAYLRPGFWLFEALEEQIMKRQGTHVWRISARRRVPALPWRLLASLLLVFICVVHLTTRWSISTPSRSCMCRNIKKAAPLESSMDAAVESLFPYLRLEQTGEEGIAGLLRW